MDNSLRVLLIAFTVILIPITGNAALLTSNTFDNFSVYGFDGSPGGRTGGPETRAIGGQSFTWTSTFNSSFFDEQDSYGLGGPSSNGRWTSNRNGYAALNSNNPDDSMTFTFDNLVSGVGGFINYSRLEGNPILSIHGAGGNVLETFDLAALAPINTRGQDDQGAFRGFQRATADIKSFTLSGAFVVIDDLTIETAAAVPVPASLTLLLGGLLSLGFLGLRRKAA